MVLVVPLLSWREVALNSRNLWLQSTTRGCPTLQTWAQKCHKVHNPTWALCAPRHPQLPLLEAFHFSAIGAFFPPPCLFLSFFLSFVLLPGWISAADSFLPCKCVHTHRNARGGLCWCDCAQHTHLSNRDSHVLCAYTGHVQM